MGSSARKQPDPSLMRNLGMFFKHIADAIHEDVDAKPTDASDSKSTDARAGRADEGAKDQSRLEVHRDVQEARRGDYRLRRTTVDEVFFEPRDQSGDSHAGDTH
jgi:hypothetical protein